MKVSDYIANFLETNQIGQVFAVTGGASLHLIDSIKKKDKTKIYFPIHEQTCAMAAEAYSRISMKTGVAITTSGPGATNLATGISGAYFDSVPVMYITGQVSTTRSRDGTGVRQIGFQETDCVNMFKPITKFAYKIKVAKEVPKILEQAYKIANTGRKGPVLIDIPDNIQRENIKISKKYIKKIIYKNNKNSHINNTSISKLYELLKNSKRPIFIFGWGVHLSDSYKEASKIIKRFGIPYVTTWALAHLHAQSDKFKIGTWGTHGSRFANFSVQNADLIISIGSRLDTKATGTPINTFARGAKKVMVDIDKNEINKFKKFDLNIDLKFNVDAKIFINKLLRRKRVHTNKPEIKKWLIQINKWKKKYPILKKEYSKQKFINPYYFIDTLSKCLPSKSIISVDTGCSIAWSMQAFSFKDKQYLFHDFNNTAMGWSIPAAISFALYSKKKIIVITGDGSLSFMLNELSFISDNNLPIKIFLLNNKGHSMIKQTQDQWLKSQYFGSSHEGGLAKINFIKVAKSFSLDTFNLRNTKSLKDNISNVLKSNTPTLCNIEINENYRVVPQVKFGKPNEDPEPLLERDEFYKNMIIKPIS